MIGERNYMLEILAWKGNPELSGLGAFMTKKLKDTEGMKMLFLLMSSMTELWEWRDGRKIVICVWVLSCRF